MCLDERCLKLVTRASVLGKLRRKMLATKLSLGEERHTSHTSHCEVGLRELYVVPEVLKELCGQGQARDTEERL